MFRTKIFIVTLYLILSHLTYSQVVNVDKQLYLTDSIGLSGSINGKASYINNGNKILHLGAGGDIVIKDTTKNLILTSQYQLNKVDAAHLHNATIIQLRYIRKNSIGPLHLEGFIQHEFNEQNRIDYRLSINGGGRLSVFNKDHSQIHIGAGVNYEVEKLSVINTVSNQNIINKEWRMNAYLSARIFPTENMKFYAIIYYLPLLSDFSDTRILSKLTAQQVVTNRLSLDLTVTYTYDDQPAEDVQKANSLVDVGLTYIF